MKNFDDYKTLIEQSINILGIDPMQSRCSEAGQWLLYNGDTEIYVDLWEQKEMTGWQYFQPDGYTLNVFQVLAPICYLPIDQTLLKQLYEELLENNLNMLFASYTVNKAENMLAVKFRRICNSLKQEDVIEAIESVGYYAETTKNILEERYGVKRLEKSSE